MAILAARSEVKSIRYSAGANQGGIQAIFGGGQGRNTAEINVQLMDKELRPLSTKEIAKEIEPLIATIPDIVKLEVSVGDRMSSAMGGGSPIEANYGGELWGRRIMGTVLRSYCIWGKKGL